MSPLTTTVIVTRGSNRVIQSPLLPHDFRERAYIKESLGALVIFGRAVFDRDVGRKFDFCQEKCVVYFALYSGTAGRRESRSLRPRACVVARGASAYERRRIRNPRNTSRRKVAFSCKSFCRSAWLPSTAFYYACVPYWQ